MAEHMTAEQQELLSVAREAQFRAVKNAMREHFVGGRKMMRPYDDTRHYYAKIYSWSLPPGGAKARRALSKFAALGLIEELPRATRPGAVRLWRFPRAVCDQLAIRARDELLAEGYEQ